MTDALLTESTKDNDEPRAKKQKTFCLKDSVYVSFEKKIINTHECKGATVV